MQNHRCSPCGTSPRGTFKLLAFLITVGIGLPNMAAWSENGVPSPWRPISLDLSVPVGSGKTVTVVYVPERRLENVSIRILNPGVDVVVEPSQWAVLERGVPVKLTVLVSTPQGAKPGEHFTADIVMNHDAEKTGSGFAQGSPFAAMPLDWERRDHHRRLPIAVTVTKNTNPVSDVTVYANPDSPDIMGFETNTGYFVSLFGPRDPDGNATGFNELIATQGSSQSSMTFDSSGRPLQVILSDGHTLGFSWTSALAAEVTILDANANILATVPLTFTAPAAAAAPGNIVEVAKAFNATHPRAGASALSKIAPAAAIVPSQTNLAVTVVTPSGAPVSDAIVQGQTVLSGLGIGIPLQFTPGTAPGTYLAFYPNNPALIALNDAQEVCDSMATGLTNVCDAGTQGAGIINQMIEGGCAQMSLPAAQYAPGLEGLCLAAFGTAEFLCEFKEGFDAVCPAIFAVPNLFVPGTITVNLKAAAEGVSVSDSVAEPGDASNATATLVLPIEPPTVTLTANPASILNGANSSLTWVSSNANSCAAAAGWTTSTATSGTASVGPLDAGNTYSITCTGDQGTTTASVMVSVSPVLDGTYIAAPVSGIGGGESTCVHTETDTVTGIDAVAGSHVYVCSSTGNPDVTGSFTWSGTITGWTLGPVGSTVTGQGSITLTGIVSDPNGTRPFSDPSGMVQANTDGTVWIGWTATDPLSGTGIGSTAFAYLQ